MALTFALSNLTRDSLGQQRLHHGTLTLTGTNSDDGDALAAEAIGLAKINQLILTPAIGSTSNPENALLPKWNPSSGKIVFYTAHGTPGGAVPLLQVTDGTTLTGYVLEFIAIGR